MNFIVIMNSNKTGGYRRHTLRLLIFVKKVYEKMKTFFPRKKTTSFAIFSDFYGFENSLTLLPKKPYK